MKVTSFRRATAALVAALLAGFGFVVGLAPAAQAHHTTISATSVECGYAQNTWIIRWSLQNSEPDKSETITASSHPGLVPVGTVIGPGATFVARQTVDAPVDQAMEVTAEWENGVSNTSRGFVSKADFPLNCWDGGGNKAISYCHQGDLATSTQLQFYLGGHLSHDADIYPAGSFIRDGETIAWGAHGDQALLTSGCTTEPYDECSALPGAQPKGFPCTKEPTTRTVERSEDGCDVGGVRTWIDVYTTTYTFTDGEWVANPESGPVRENEEFTAYTAEELIAKGCETTVLIAPSIEVADACGSANDTVTLSTSDHYTGVDNGDGTATFTAAPGYVFETAGGEVVELTLTYTVPSSEPCAISTEPSLVVIDACGSADDTVTLSTGDHYAGVDNGDGTAIFTAAAGYVFETAGGEVVELTLSYTVPSSEPCVVTAAKATKTPPTCADDGTLVIPEQPVGVKVTPTPGTYGPGTYRVTFTPEPGYSLAKDPSRRYKIGKAVNNLCPDDDPQDDPDDSPDLPNTGGDPSDGNPNAAGPTPATPALPNTGANPLTSSAAGAGLLALLAGIGMVLMGRSRLSREDL